MKFSRISILHRWFTLLLLCYYSIISDVILHDVCFVYHNLVYLQKFTFLMYGSQNYFRKQIGPYYVEHLHMRGGLSELVTAWRFMKVFHSLLSQLRMSVPSPPSEMDGHVDVRLHLSVYRLYLAFRHASF